MNLDSMYQDVILDHYKNPHHKGLRPAWLLRLGLFLYDHIGGRKLLPLLVHPATLAAEKQNRRKR